LDQSSLPLSSTLPRQYQRQKNGGDLAIAATLVHDLPVSPADMPRTRPLQMRW